MFTHYFIPVSPKRAAGFDCSISKEKSLPGDIEMDETELPETKTDEDGGRD